jgi:hypothetical protein
MPLVQGEEVVGVFELFSDKPNVFDARDIAALERMGGMVFTAFEQAAAGFSPKSDKSSTAPAAEVNPQSEDPNAGEAAPTSFGNIRDEQATPHGLVPATEADEILETGVEEMPLHQRHTGTENTILADPHDLASAEPGTNTGGEFPIPEQPETPTPSSPRSAVANLGRCQGCGFPVSEGRQLCLDCEKKAAQNPEGFVRAPELPSSTPLESLEGSPAISFSALHEGSLFGSQGQENASWLSSHKYMLGAIAVAVAGIVVVLLVR